MFLRIPDFPFLGWVAILLAFLAAISIPFYMIIRIKAFRVLRNRAASRSRNALIFYWILLVVSYLMVVWLVFLFYFKGVYK